jgi:hypothetical protein
MTPGAVMAAGEGSATERRRAVFAVLDAVVAAALAAVIGRAVPWGATGRPRELGVALAAAVVVAAIALDGGATSRAVVAVRSAAVGVAAAALAALHGVAAAVPLGVAAGILALVGAGAVRLVAGVGGADRARLATLLGLALAGAAPVWAAPAVEALGAPVAAVNALVAASPLTYLAVMGSVDYLHQPWFYAWSPVASLRFAYPTAAALTAGHLAVGVLLWRR